VRSLVYITSKCHVIQTENFSGDFSFTFSGFLGQSGRRARTKMVGPSATTETIGVARGGPGGLGPPKGVEKHLHNVFAVQRGHIYTVRESMFSNCECD